MTGDLKNAFEELMIENEPPLTTSTEKIIRSGRRRQTRRRLEVWGVAAMTVVTTGVVVAATAGFGSLGGGEDSADVPANPPGYYPPVSSWREYSQAVHDLFLEEGPDFRYGSGEDDYPFELLESDSVSTGDPDVEYEIPRTGIAFLKTSDGTPVGSAFVQLYEPGPWSTEPEDDQWPLGFGSVFAGESIVSCWSGENEEQQESTKETKIRVTDTDCEEGVTSSGDQLIRVSRVEHYKDEPPGSYTNTVVVYRADGTAVTVNSFCGNEDEDDEYGGTCKDIQFDLDQLEAIAVALPAVIVTDGDH